MTEQRGQLKRRGLVAAAAALVTGVATARTAQPVAATTTDTNFVATGSGTGFTANGSFTTGVYGIGATFGVIGSGNAYGVYGSTGAAGGNGVNGAANGSGSYGVLGTTSGPGSVACSGQATGGGSYGVYGTSTTSHGVYGITAAPAAAAVFGYTTAQGASAINGAAGSGSYAGTFSGPVVVNGQFVAYGGGKSAAVPHPDGSHRLLYCMESPESWFEDFGEGTLTAGKAEVKLDPDFAAVVDTSKLHVFLTPHDETHHLAVKARGAGGFSVAADVAALAPRGVKPGDVNGAFSYRVVAKRKDITGERLAKFTPPTVDTSAPKAPAPPKVTLPTLPEVAKKP